MYYMYPYVLMEATGYISPKTGQKVEMTANDKNVYLVMKKRNTFFKNHFDKQEDIARLCGISLKQSGRILRKLIEEGVIETECKKDANSKYKNYRYLKVLDLQLYSEELVEKETVTKLLDKIPESIWTSERQEKLDKPSVKTYIQPSKKINNFDDELDLPF